MQMGISDLADVLEMAFMAGFRTGRAGEGLLSEEQAQELLAKGDLRAKLEEAIVDPVEQ